MAGFFIIRSKILYLAAHFLQVFFYFLFERKSRMIRTDGNFHFPAFLSMS